METGSLHLGPLHSSFLNLLFWTICISPLTICPWLASVNGDVVQLQGKFFILSKMSLYVHPSIHPSIHARTHARTHTDLPTDRPTYLPTYLPTDLSTDIPTDVPTDIPTDLPTYRPTYRPTDRPTDPPTYRPTYLPTHAYLRTYLNGYTKYEKWVLISKKVLKRGTTTKVGKLVEMQIQFLFTKDCLSNAKFKIFELPIQELHCYCTVDIEVMQR